VLDQRSDEKQEYYWTFQHNLNSGLMLTFIFVIRATTTPGAQSVSASSGVADFSPLPLSQSSCIKPGSGGSNLIAHFQLPEDYIASKFKDHQLVFLGEGVHGSKQNLLFLQKLIPRLYEAGVYNIGFEMICSDEQPEVDRLLAAKQYDNTKALTLLFHWDPAIGFAAQEYADVLRAAWTLNQNLLKAIRSFA